MSTDSTVIGTVEAHYVFLNTGVAHHTPELHSRFTRNRDEVGTERFKLTLKLRPILPMVMRGVPATRQKGMYIFFDAAREARAAGVPYGNFYDPIGEPARRAYSLWPWAEQQGRGLDAARA